MSRRMKKRRLKPIFRILLRIIIFTLILGGGYFTYDKYLSNAYGNYMKLPPLEKRVAHHDFIAYWITQNKWRIYDI